MTSPDSARDFTDMSMAALTWEESLSGWVGVEVRAMWSGWLEGVMERHEGRTVRRSDSDAVEAGFASSAPEEFVSASTSALSRLICAGVTDRSVSTSWADSLGGDISASCSRILPLSLPRLQYSDPSTAALTTSRPHPTPTVTASDNTPMPPDESRPASTVAAVARDAARGELAGMVCSVNDVVVVARRRRPAAVSGSIASVPAAPAAEAETLLRSVRAAASDRSSASSAPSGRRVPSASNDDRSA